jgi:hypothetical protein
MNSASLVDDAQPRVSWFRSAIDFTPSCDRRADHLDHLGGLRAAIA